MKLGKADALLRLSPHRCKVPTFTSLNVEHLCGLQVHASKTNSEFFVCPQHGTILEELVEPDVD